MYEPWGERKFRARIKEFGERLKEGLRGIKTRKWLAVLIAVIGLASVGSYTGYVSYTSQIAEFNSRIMILEKQLKACQDNVTLFSTQLTNTKNELASCRTEKESCESNLEIVKADLNDCNSAREELSSNLEEIKGSVEEWKSRYEEAQSNYESLQSKQESLTCNYAKDVCGSRGMSYYFVSNDKIGCCLKNDPDYCIPVDGNTPTAEEIREITC